MIFKKISLFLDEALAPTFYNGGLSLVNIFPLFYYCIWKDSVNKNTFHNIRKLFNEKYGLKNTYFVNSGRSALYLLLISLDRDYRDEIILPSYTCVVIPNAIRFAGYKVVYCDIEDQTYNIDVNKLSDLISKKTKAIIHQYTYGIPNNIDFVKEICNNSNILFIEDCAHALGSKYKNMYTGTFGDAAFFSLQKTKMVTTYAGGILTVNNENINKYVKKNFNNLTYIDSLKEKKMIYQIINSYFKHHIIIKYFYKRIKRLVVNNLSSISKKISYYLIDPLKEEKSAERNGDMSKSYLEILPNKLLLILKMQINNLDKDVERRNFYSEEIIQIMSEIGLKIPDYDRKIIYPSWNRLPFQVKSRENLILVLNKLQIPYSLWFDNPLYQSNEKTRLLNNYNKELYPCSKKVSEHIINLTVSRSVNWYYIKKLKKISDSFN